MVGLCITLAVILAGIVLWYYRQTKKTPSETEKLEALSLDELAESVLDKLSEEISASTSTASNSRIAESIKYKKKALRKARDEASYGIASNIEYLKGVFMTILQDVIPDIKTARNVLDFEEWRTIVPNFQWELLAYIASKKAPSRRVWFTWLFETMRWDKAIRIDDGICPPDYDRFIVTQERLEEAIEKLYTEPLEYYDHLYLLATCIYNYYIGHGCLQTIRLSNVDGFNFGASGSVRYDIDGNFDAPYRFTNSVWVQVNAAWIHLPFLDFYTSDEMNRVALQLSSYGLTAPLTEKNPYKVNDAYDGARVSIARGPMGECTGGFVRKFSASSYTLDSLLNHHGVKNWELVRDDIIWKMKGIQNTAFTGQQNLGKTSLMKAAAFYIRLANIRVLEMSFELALRELYPWLNVFTVRPTDTVTDAEAQDFLKKTDAYISMVGEVAQAKVAARMIQFGFVGSAGTFFTYHNIDVPSLINGLANQLVQSGEYTDKDVAITDVLAVVKHDVHLDFFGGNRRVAYIAEIEPMNQLIPYPDLKQSSSVIEAIDQLASLQREYYTRETDRVKFQYHVTIAYDEKTNSYVTKDVPSPNTIKSIYERLTESERPKYLEWLDKNWGLSVCGSKVIA